MREKALAFISGSMLTIINNLGEDVFRTILYGLLGGIAGMAGKECYSIIKEKVKSWLKQR